MPALIQRFYVKPANCSSRGPTSRATIALTQEAYNLAGSASKPFPVRGGAELCDGWPPTAATVENIRLWDGQPLSSTYAQLQEIRTYYSSSTSISTAIGWVADYQQVTLAGA